jgi:ArsR family transcriptional regulator, arsenate/arsenite/antimonite-responsive transcriptional repressor
VKEFMAIAKALADENRTRTLLFLRRGEMCVCQIVEMLALAPSTVSKHLDVLERSGLIESRKEGRWVYYRLPLEPSPCARQTLQWVKESLAEDSQMIEDTRRAGTVRRMDKEGLCCRYKRAAKASR